MLSDIQRRITFVRRFPGFAHFLSVVSFVCGGVILTGGTEVLGVGGGWMVECGAMVE
jgi:hypothetical protein